MLLCGPTQVKGLLLLLLPVALLPHQRRLVRCMAGACRLAATTISGRGRWGAGAPLLLLLARRLVLRGHCLQGNDALQRWEAVGAAQLGNAVHPLGRPCSAGGCGRRQDPLPGSGQRDAGNL